MTPFLGYLAGRGKATKESTPLSMLTWSVLGTRIP